MKRNLITIAAVLALATTAHAGNNNGPVFGGTQNYTTTNNTTNAPVANGGSASSTVRNDVSSTNLNANTNSVRNDNANVQGQGQKQGQQQGQKQGQGQLQGQQQSAISGGNKLTNEGNNSAQSTSVKVEGDVYEAARIPVATAYAAPLTASNGTCMGSSSAGGQGLNLGLSFGTTWTDDNCDRRYDAQELRAQGLVKAATALMCQKPSIAAAMKEAGTPCPAPAAQAAASTSPAAQADVAQVQYTDPIIRRRLGLPPL